MAAGRQGTDLMARKHEAQMKALHGHGHERWLLHRHQQEMRRQEEEKMEKFKADQPLHEISVTSRSLVFTPLLLHVHNYYSF